MTLFIFPPTATRTRIIPSDLWLIASDLDGLGRLRLPSRISMIHGDLSSLLCPLGFHLLHVFLTGDLDRKELLDHINPHGVMELLEESKTFFLVFLERILLGIATQPNGFLEVIHGQQMVFP
jgi:hypothetical protein